VFEADTVFAKGNIVTGSLGIGASFAIFLVSCASNLPTTARESVWGEATVVTDMTIGVELGSEEYMLGRVDAVAVANDGRIYIGEAQAFSRADGGRGLIRVFNADGTHLYNLGRVGEGPGEYIEAEPHVLPDGRPIVWDSGRRRVSVFSMDGIYEYGFSADTGWRPIIIDKEGSFYMIKSKTVQEDAPPELVLLKYSVEGKLLDTIPVPNPHYPAKPGIYDFMLGLEGGLSPCNSPLKLART